MFLELAPAVLFVLLLLSPPQLHYCSVQTHSDTISYSSTSNPNKPSHAAKQHHFSKLELTKAMIAFASLHSSADGCRAFHPRSLIATDFLPWLVWRAISCRFWHFPGVRKEESTPKSRNKCVHFRTHKVSQSRCGLESLFCHPSGNKTNLQMKKLFLQKNKVHLIFILNDFVPG